MEPTEYGKYFLFKRFAPLFRVYHNVLFFPTRLV